jgi:hypothetical protein
MTDQISGVFGLGFPRLSTISSMLANGELNSCSLCDLLITERK